MHKSKLQLLLENERAVWLIRHLHNALHYPQHFIHHSELTATRTLHDLTFAQSEFGFPFTESMVKIEKPNKNYGQSLMQAMKLPENEDSLEFFSIFNQAQNLLDLIENNIKELSVHLAEMDCKSNIFGLTRELNLNSEAESSRLSLEIEQARNSLAELESQVEALMKKHHNAG